MKTAALVCVLVVLAGCLPVPARPGAAAGSLTPAGAMSTQTAQPVPAAAESVPTLTPTPAACVVTGTGSLALNVRAAPSKAAAILGGLRPGQRVTVESWGLEWHKIDSGQYSGYVYAIYCEEP